MHSNRSKRCPLFYSKERQHSFFFFTSAILILSILVECGPRKEDLEAVEYTPLSGDDWKVSTPAEQGLDPMLVAELYLDATELETLYGLLVIKNGYLIAEGYFNDGSIEQVSSRQSVTKSYTSALVGIALDQGCLSDVDQKMMDFFPEFAGQIDDPRKEQITIRDMLQMRSGYPPGRSARLLIMIFSFLATTGIGCPTLLIFLSPAIREPSSVTAI